MVHGLIKCRVSNTGWLVCLQSNQEKRTPEDYMYINELIIWLLNPLVISRMQ